MYLSVKQIQRLLKELQYETEYLSENSLVRLQRHKLGYAEDPETCALQGILSVMLAAATQSEARQATGKSEARP